jgi:Fe-S-cluster containining protein
MGKVSLQTMNRCMRCGTCCRKGGPVLHFEDMEILRHHHAEYAHLVTIRRGEMTYNPVSKRIAQAEHEMVKVAGNGDTWACYYYREHDTSCMIYEHRFLECRLLKCWQPEDVMSVIGKDAIGRSDVINRDDPVLLMIERHEKECSMADVQQAINEALSGENSAKARKNLSVFMQKDTEIRSYAFSELDMKPEYELFIFGRPLVEIIEDFGLAVHGLRNDASEQKKRRPNSKTPKKRLQPISKSYFMI